MAEGALLFFPKLQRTGSSCREKRGCSTLRGILPVPELSETWSWDSLEMSALVWNGSAVTWKKEACPLPARSYQQGHSFTGIRAYLFRILEYTEGQQPCGLSNY